MQVAKSPFLLPHRAGLVFLQGAHIRSVCAQARMKNLGTAKTDEHPEFRQAPPEEEG